jgi:hypothetical protein
VIYKEKERNKEGIEMEDPFPERTDKRKDKKD